MDASWFNGSDYRDTLDAIDPDCAHCGAGPNEICTPDCDCSYCLRKAAREDARQRELELAE
jgi:hypothetical protein